MIPDANGKPESQSQGADELERLLQIELIQKKMEWAAASERYRKIRTMSFLFLALIIMGALVVFFFLILPRLQGDRPNHPAPDASASP
jgi:cell division protein FtsX